MRFFFRTILALAALTLLAGGGAGLWATRTCLAPGPLPQTAIVAIGKGMGVAAIAARLEEEKVIAHPLLFRAAARLSGDDTRLRAGEYEFQAGVSLKQVIAKMAAGDVYLRRFTVPEGLTSRQVVRLLNDIPDLDGTVTDIPPEGSLLPETYSYMKGDTRADKLAAMQKAMKDLIAELWQSRPRDAPLLSEAETVILASIVEKETGVPEERRRIAGVFINRLTQGIPLQTDPTVIYALTGGDIQSGGQGPLGRRLLSADLQVDSPYNTYKHPGLPPGPIANPGKAALEAAINPERNDFLYFVADGTGGHVFARTLAEHNENAAKWRKLRKEKGE